MLLWCIARTGSGCYYPIMPTHAAHHLLDGEFELDRLNYTLLSVACYRDHRQTIYRHRSYDLAIRLALGTGRPPSVKVRDVTADAPISGQWGTRSVGISSCGGVWRYGKNPWPVFFTHPSGGIVQKKSIERPTRGPARPGSWSDANKVKITIYIHALPRVPDLQGLQGLAHVRCRGFCAAAAAERGRNSTQ